MRRDGWLVVALLWLAMRGRKGGHVVNSPSVLAWKAPLVAGGAAGVAPVPFLLSWIRVESGGLVAAVGGRRDGTDPLDANGDPWEVSIWQLDPGNRQVAGGFTVAQLRPGCVKANGNTAHDQEQLRALTPDEVATQVAAGLAYVRWCRTVVDAALGQTATPWVLAPPPWSNDSGETGADYLRAVKSVHGSPWVMRFGLPAIAARLKRPPRDFDELAAELLRDPPPGAPGSLAAVLQNARETWPLS